MPRLLAAARLATLLVVAGFALFVARDAVRRHPENLPWTPLDLTAPIGWATATKLAALRDHPAECRALLAAAGVAFTDVAPRRDGRGCSLAGAVRVADVGTPLEPAGLALSCPLAAALTVWDRQVVVPAARAAGARATAIVTFGSYNCRTVAGSDRLSEHATANAVDIAGVRVVPDGPPSRAPAVAEEVTVARDWAGGGERGTLVRRLHAGACRLFTTTLSPAYNAAHHDHLHLDMGGWRACR